MAKRKSRATTSKPEPPAVQVECSGCKQQGMAGSQILPYSIAKGVVEWMHRGCFLKGRM